MPTNRMRPIHPGEILSEEFLKPLDMSANRLAEALGVPSNRISLIIAGERGITADTALRLSAAFGTTVQFWLNLQQNYELRLEEQNKEHAAERRGIRRLVNA
jgi:antitoxin HigA-1